MYYRIQFRACPDVYLFELKKDKARVSHVIRQIKELFKIKHSTIKVFNESEIELSSQDFIHSGRTYIVRRLPPLVGKRNDKRRVIYT